jgi:uncharacterized protein YfaS (alpha-2-macroglobulin family)
MKNQILLFAILLFVFSCKNKPGEETLLDASKDQALLDQYFGAATVGVISSTDELRYILKEPLDQEVPEDILQNVITLNPAVPGKVTLTNNTVLAFTPSQALASGQSYEVTLDLKALDAKRYSEKLTYTIKTFAQDMSINREGIIINEDGSVSVILGVKTADKADTEKLKSCFTTDATTVDIVEVNPNDYDLDFKWNSGMKESSSISYDGKNIGAESKGVVDLFKLNPKEFVVVYTHHNADKREFNIYFSQRLEKKTDLSGLLKVQGQNASYTINNNVLTIFLAELRDLNTVKIDLDKSIMSVDRKTLLTNQSFDVQLQIDNPDIQFVSDGNYFPSEGDFKIPVKTRALQKMRLTVIEIKQENVMHYLAWQSLQYADFYNLRMYGRPVFDEIVHLNQGIKDNEGWLVHGIDLSNRIRKNPGSIYHISMEFAPEHTTLSCNKDLKKYEFNTKIPDSDYFKIKDNYYDDYYYYGDDYDWQESSNPCKLAYYVNKQPVQRLFICSDYSVIAKKAGSSYHIALNKLMDLSSVSGADVTLYNLQAEKITNGVTDSDGFIAFHQIKDEAAVLKVDKNRQVTYLSLDPNQSNPLTEFDIAGERSETETEFFSYTDRDVYRPGDSIFVDLMINKSVCDLPKGIPIVMKFYNVDNLVINEQIQNLDMDKNLIYSFKLSTPTNAKTGTYRCLFRIGSKKVSHNIRIETIKPNTAEVVYSFENYEDKTIYSDQILGSLQAKYLTGFEIAGAKVVANARARKMVKPFTSYGDFHFDVYDSEISNNIELLNVMTNSNGVANFANENSLKYFNTPIKVSIETETALPNGGTNKEGSSVTVSPFTSYIGASRKEGTGWNGNHTFAENIEVNLVNLTNRGKLVSTSNTVNYTIQQHMESWWVDKYRLRSSGNFVNQSFWKDISSASVSITGKGKIIFPKGKLGKGAYKLTMTDETSGHKTQVYFTVYDGKESIPGAQPYIVEFQTNKDEYKAGEQVQIKLPDIPDAKALISIERGSKVIEQKWVNLSKDKSTISLPTSENWAPNVYVHISVVQKYAQQNNDYPLRMYGLKYLKMNGATSPLTPVSTLADQLESNKAYNFTVSEKESRPMEYTIAIVDEGLLNLTGFSTPDPTKHFNGKFPLLVKTWDIYQYLLAFFKGKYAGIISIGGDDVYNPDAIAEINRFKPVAMHLGPFKTGTNGKNNHKIYIPNYIGKVRLMVVACNDKNFGKLEKLIPVKNPLMVQTQLPRSLNVTDKLNLPVTILKDDKTISNATLVAKADATMVKGFSGSIPLTFGGKNQLSHVYDNIEVLNKTGKMVLDLAVNSGTKGMKESTNILVNYPNSYESSIKKDIIEPNQSIKMMIEPKGYKEVFTSKVMISGLKVPNFTQYAAELIEYPYGCLEQTTSGGFGQLYLDKILNLDPTENRKRLEHLQSAMLALGRFQDGSGKFKYWENNYYHAWSDVYAGNFLVEMKKQNQLGGYQEMLDRWTSAHNTIANNWALAEASNDYTYESETLVQAYRLFVLAKAGKSAKSALNRFVTSNKSKNPLTWWLIAGSFKLSGYESKSVEYVKKAEGLQKEYKESYSYQSFGDKGRDWALIVEVLSYIEKDQNKLEAYYDQMVDILNNQNWASTQTKGYAFIAAYQYFGKSLQMAKDVEYTITGLKSGTKTFKHSSYEPKMVYIQAADFNKSISVKNTGKGKLYVYQTSRFIDNNPKKDGASSNLGISVSYSNSTRKQSGLKGTKLGDDIIINVSISNPSALDINDLALNVKMPSGWELINPRLYETNVVPDAGNFNYQDYRDDRVYTFFGLRPGEKRNFSFKAKAAFTGDFFMPAISCEHMYKGTIYAKTSTERVLVGK